jgi:gamma-glutamylcyclotransferase (GGCT)/AIG2-like uncharacterized protein YtfP
MASQFKKKSESIDKLFVYGSLNNAYNLRLVTGHDLVMAEATLYNYRRIHPESGYPFALHWKGSKIEGRVIYGVTPDIFKKIDEYESEGRLYVRKSVEVYVNDQAMKAYTYIGIPHALKPFFKQGIGIRDRIEEFIERSVNKYLEDKPDRCWIDDREALSLQVTKELLSEETHSLIRQYFHDAGLPPFIMRHELEKASIPSLEWLRSESKAVAYADHYLKLAVKLMIFNQIEERFRQEFRSQVQVGDAYYLHSISAVMAFKLLVSHYQHVQSAISQLDADKYDPTFTYIDYAVAAIFIAEELYTPQRTQEIVDWVQTNQHPGMLPLGAELEFSTLGFRAVPSKEGDDPMFDNFYYFYDFDLMRRGWKLGAHVDDHGFLTTTHTRTRGFLELAFGRYRLLGDVSKPATNDPWILSQLIDLAIRYMGIKPHSLHISLQTEANTPFQKIDHPEYLFCLLLLGGDLREDKEGNLREMRIYQGEIVRSDHDVYFSRFNRHHKNPEDTEWSFVIEYQFPRLSFDCDYQPLIMALKGFQLGGNPYPLKNYRDCPYQEFHRDIETALFQWAAEPTPVSEHTLNSFLSLLEKGLAKETSFVGQQEYARYVQHLLVRIEMQLKRRNKRIQSYHAYKQRTAHHGT